MKSPKMSGARCKSRSVTHPQIAPGQARLTSEFFGDRLPEKKLQLIGISILLILLSSGPGCHSQLVFFERKSVGFYWGVVETSAQVNKLAIIFAPLPVLSSCGTCLTC